MQGAGNTNCSALSYAGTLQANLAYDAMGRLAESTGNMLKTEPGAMTPTTGTTRYLHDGDALVLEYGAAGSVLRRYVHGANAKADDPLFWFEGTAPAWLSQRELFADHQGSIVATALPRTGIADSIECPVAFARENSGNSPPDGLRDTKNGAQKRTRVKIRSL